VRLRRNSSGSGDSSRERDAHESESDGGDRSVDLAALRRETLEDPGTISMLGTISKRLSKGDTEIVPDAERLRALFDLPESERIDAGLFRLRYRSSQSSLPGLSRTS
jgi:hypothetical protein